MMPGVSAGSNQVGASATWEAHVNCPDGDALGDCAEACVAATRTTATTRATTRARERVMVCPPLRCDKGETCSGLRGCPIIPESFPLSMGCGLSMARRAPDCRPSRPHASVRRTWATSSTWPSAPGAARFLRASSGARRGGRRRSPWWRPWWEPTRAKSAAGDDAAGDAGAAVAGGIGLLVVRLRVDHEAGAALAEERPRHATLDGHGLSDRIEAPAARRADHEIREITRMGAVRIEASVLAPCGIEVRPGGDEVRRIASTHRVHVQALRTRGQAGDRNLDPYAVRTLRQSRGRDLLTALVPEHGLRTEGWIDGGRGAATEEEDGAQQGQASPHPGPSSSRSERRLSRAGARARRHERGTA